MSSKIGQIREPAYGKQNTPGESAHTSKGGSYTRNIKNKQYKHAAIQTQI